MSPASTVSHRHCDTRTRIRFTFHIDGQLHFKHYSACILSDAVSSWGHLALCPAKWKNLNYRIYLLSVPLCHFFIVSRSLSRSQHSSFSSSTRIFNDFTRIFRFISPIPFLISPASNIVSGSSFFTSLQRNVHSSIFSISLPNFPFRFPRVLYICHRWNTIRLLELGWTLYVYYLRFHWKTIIYYLDLFVLVQMLVLKSSKTTKNSFTKKY